MLCTESPDWKINFLSSTPTIAMCHSLCQLGLEACFECDITSLAKVARMSQMVIARHDIVHRTNTYLDTGLGVMPISNLCRHGDVIR